MRANKVEAREEVREIALVRALSPCLFLSLGSNTNTIPEEEMPFSHVDADPNIRGSSY